MMKNIKVTLPDNSVKKIAQGATPQGVAEEIGPGLARAVVVASRRCAHSMSLGIYIHYSPTIV